MRNPNFVHNVALDTGTEVTWIDQYHRAPCEFVPFKSRLAGFHLTVDKTNKKVKGRFVESSTTLTMDSKETGNVTKGHVNQEANKKED